MQSDRLMNSEQASSTLSVSTPTSMLPQDAPLGADANASAVETLPVTAVVCTRHRAQDVARAAQSILGCGDALQSLIVVDQSADDSTQLALEPLMHDARLRYVRTDVVGKPAALNLALQLSTTDIVCLTDDDCEVPPDWLTVMAAAMRAYPRIAIAFCIVDAGPYDPRAGFVPAYHRTGNELIRTVGRRCNAHALGAGMAVNRQILLSLGGFDEMLGPGAPFQDCDDADIAFRVLLGGYSIYETDQARVVHHGFRTWEQGRGLAERNYFGIGAMCAKLLRCTPGRFGLATLHFWGNTYWLPIRDLLHLRKPQGIVRITAFMRGFARGWRTPIDRQRLVFTKR
jgi:GT2 family glycosyltransferase